MPTARRFTTTQLLHWCIAETDRDRAELIVSELAGNAARHGQANMIVHLSLGDHELRISVTDTGLSAASARPSSQTPQDEGGRGLQLVALLADWLDIRPQRHGWHAGVGVRISLHDGKGPADLPHTRMENSELDF